MKIIKKIIETFSSFGTAIVLLLFMFLLVFLGTLEQVDMGLYYVQQKYFESFYLVYDLYGIPIPLPGGALVMGLFAVNLTIGGLIRIRKKKVTFGIIVAHVGILFMLLGGLITWKIADNGHMTLYESQSSDEFVSYTEWNIEIHDPNTAKIHLIPQELFDDLDPGESRTFYAEDLPFEVTLSGFGENTQPLPVGPAMKGKVHEIDGYFLQTIDRDTEASRNMPGAYATFKDKKTGETSEAILWGMAVEPASFTANGETWMADFSRKRWKVPFTVVLDEFIHEVHPGTTMASNYESVITKIEGSSSERVRIYMNTPMRHKGYTFFQESFGRSSFDSDQLYSQLAVWRNPSDHWPLYACIVIGAGLLFHFLQKLAGYIASENKRRLAT